MRLATKQRDSLEDSKVQVSAHVLFLSGVSTGLNYQPLVQLLEEGSEVGEEEKLK